MTIYIIFCKMKNLQTVAVVKEGKEGLSADTKEERLLEVVCHITVLPGNPTKSYLEGDDWDTVSC